MMYAMAAANMDGTHGYVGLHGHAFSERMQGFHPQLDGFLVGNSTSLPSHTPAHLSLSLVPICARKPWYLHDALVHILLPPAIPCFFPALPISLILCTTVSTSYCTTPFLDTTNPLPRRSAKFCSTTIRHPHASLDGLQTQSFLHCLLTRLGRTHTKFFRHVLQLGLHHLRHNRES